MPYVIYEKESSRIVSHPITSLSYYHSIRSARGALTKMKNTYPSYPPVQLELAVADLCVYRSSIEQTEIVTNMLTGLRVTQSVNTPLSCDPSSETFHNM